jgi:hypothetical protein
MKSKGSASLYEVLKSASRPGPEPSPAPASAETAAPAHEGQPSLKERLAAYKAQKLAEAQAPAGPATAVADPTPVPVALADPTPAPVAVTRVLTPVASEPEVKPSAGPGERVLRLTYNTAAFALLVGVGLLFVAFAIGVKSGKNRTGEYVPEAAPDRTASAPHAAAGPVNPPVPPAAPKIYTIHLVEWPARKPEERLKAAEAADTYKKALEKRGFKNVETVKIMRGGEERLAMYVDRFKDVTSELAKSRISEVQKFKVQNLSPFTQASFEEVPK